MSIEQWSDLIFPDKEGKDVHVYGSVRSINNDGSYEVQLNASSVTTRCAPCCTALVGDRVLVCIKANGRCDAIGRLGGDLGGGGTIVTQYDDVSNYIAGRVFAYAGTDEPIGCLLCDGRAVSRTTYWELFNAIGTTYGAGDGSSTFNLPNIESRTVIGESDGYALGAVGGEEKHALIEAELPAHYHEIGTSETTSTSADVFGKYRAIGVESTGSNDTKRYYAAASQPAGSSQPFNIMQPYIVMRYFITTGKGDPVSGINPADYVVEWGETDGWRWEKWASGKAECETFLVNYALDSAYDDLYYTSATVDLPFELASVKAVYATGQDENNLIDASVSDITTTSVRVYISSAVANITDACASVKVSGYWKTPSASGGTETIAPTIAERLAELEARLAEAEYDTGWENVYYVASKIKVEARRVGKMVTVNARAYDGYFPAPAGSWAAITTLPAKFRPTSIKYAALGSDKNNHIGMADVEPDGLVYVISAGSAINSWGFSISYPVD